MSNEQLSLFTIHSVEVSKSVHDPYWDEITKPTLQPGDLVKLSPDWMNKCAAATAGKYKKDYQFKSEEDLICKVIWVDPRNNGHISVDRNGYGLFVPADCYTQLDGDSVIAFTSSLISDISEKDLDLVVNSSLFTEENVRAQDTSNHPIARNNLELDAVTCAPEHFEPKFTTAQFAPEHTHYTEEYWVKRGNKKHYYYRYCWMVGRKKHRIHIGSVTSPIAQAKNEEILRAIADGQSPPEIKRMLKPNL